MGVRELTPSQLELFEACRRGDIEKVKNYIASKRSKKARTPLNLLRPSTPCPGWLSSCKDPSTQYTPLHNASLHGHHHVCKILVESDRLLTSARDKRGCVPLHLASWNGHFEAMKLLVEFDTDSVDAVNNAQESPLHLAAQHGHDKVVRVLLEHHADPRLRNARFETPLDVAARTGHAVVCKILIGFCPELALQSAVDCSSTGENGQIRAQVVYPLHAAARHSHIQCLQILRLGGFDLDFVTEEGSALHVAAVFGQVEAVRYLTDEGINPHIRDSKGRTALDVLREHEGNQTSDLTYIIQSREGWSECRKIIDGYIQRLESEHFNSSSDSGIDRRDSERSIVDEDVIGDIWRPLPSISHASSTSRPSLHEIKEAVDEGKSTVQENTTIITVGEQSSSTAKAMPTYETTLAEHAIRYGGDTSPITTSPELHPVPLHRTWNSRMYDVERGIVRFPITSPMNKTRHQQSKRIGDTFPLKFSALRTTLSSQRGSVLPSDSPCIYRTPPVYDIWHQKFVQSDGITHTYNPAYPYDNIPRNLIVYDNAPTPGHSRWNHDCASTVRKANGSSFFASSRQEQTQTLPTSRPRTRPSVLNTFPSTFETLEEKTLDYKKDDSFLRTRETSNGSNLSPQFSSHKTSTTTFACSTLGRSSSPLTSSRSNPARRAPLAMPEELTGSTSTSILSSNVTPERESTALTSSNITTATSSTPNAFNDDRLERNNRSSMEFSLSTLAIDYSDVPPSPDSSRSKIFNKLCSNSKVCTKIFPSEQLSFSPETTECSGGTITSSCSLPVVSRISTTPPSDTSVYKLYHQNSDDESPSSLVKMRPGWDASTGRVSPMDSNKASESINEIEEWKKIDDILSSFGGAVCRESVFAANYESQVAVFLRDCHSQALTLQLTSQPSTNRHNLNTSSSSTCKSESEQITVSQWLCTTVGIPNPKAAEVGQILTGAGFDRLTQLHGCLTTRELSALGIEKPIQQQILSYLDSVRNAKPNAYSFNYVSDWLCSLELTDYLGNFVTAGLKTMVLVRNVGLTRDHLEKMGITLPGHVARILYSLMNTKFVDIHQKREELKNNREPGISSTSNILKEIPCETTMSFPEDDDTENGDPAKIDLLHSHASFLAHYLGSMEISNIDGTEESRRAMKAIRVIAKVPQVILEISIHGVRVLDGRTGRLAVEHEISQIQIVCQDERDLNCFTYISQDVEKNLCHVFCVLTADVATE
ncbi:hypothetical protein Angca_009417, partial [Angiostrongylus cantonensis]